MSRTLALFAVSMLSGCSLLARLNSNAQMQIPQELTYLHTVSSSDESLPMIAEWYTGEMNNWKILKSSNCNSTVFRIKAGSIIRIPAGITREHTLMPADFIIRKKNSYRLAPKEAAPKIESSTKSSVEPARPEESPASDVLSAKDELIDNLIGEISQSPSELASPSAGE